MSKYHKGSRFDDVQDMVLAVLGCDRDTCVS